jgi:hypothetical protein
MTQQICSKTNRARWHVLAANASRLQYCSFTYLPITASFSCLLQPLPVPCALLASGPVVALSTHAYLAPLEPPALLAHLMPFSVMPLISAPQAHSHLLEGSSRQQPSACASLALGEVSDEDYWDQSR